VRIAVLEPTDRGGLLHYSFQLAEALAGRGHDVDLIAARSNELAGRARLARMRAVLPAAVKEMARPQSRAGYATRRAAVAARLARGWVRILWETRPGRYDVVLHGADIGLTPNALATLLMTVVPGRPRLVRIAHNVRAFNRWGGEDMFDTSRLGGVLLRRLYPRFDLVLVHGESSRAELQALAEGTAVSVIPHGDERVFSAEPPPPSEEERVLFFGDWRKVKGLPDLMEAFDQLAARRPSARLTVAGTPSPEDWDPAVLREWARGHAGRVELIDRYVPVEDVAATFGRARVVATPYVAGYQSGVIHLAATMARPVVTSDVGDLPRAVDDGATGRVVPARDPARLADALEAVIADPDGAARMGEEARRRLLAESSWERVAERVEAELGRLQDSNG
jgi:glycosyltransferase involved in cell wall biosynthesis